ncbi:MAG: hypothetical protein ABIP51_20070 [Bacteroidia bacterium]
MNLINKYFLVKEIKSKEGIVHFRRWRILSTPLLKIYFHGIYMADEDAHLHNHPWNYWSVSVKGRFIEKTSNGFKYVPPFKIIKRKAEQFHSINLLLTKKVFTFFVAFGKKRDWGYDVNGTWVDHITYRKLKNSGKLC